ncbi:MAG TPA: ABC transporter ATP-binding protein [Candidatus Limnocylindrales bacterium]|nr:ABC transporter ATP-binding protein [Candidatus Limnocylindrales bacterium]
MSSAAIAARDLAAGYDGARIWQGATFEIAQGEFIAVLGPNGAGKSTLFRIILGLLRPAAGSLQVLGGAPRRGDARIGYVPQRRTIDVDLPVRGRDLVKLGVDGHRLGIEVPGPARVAADRRVAEAIHAVRADAYADRRVGRLSGGEQQRLSLAQALVGKPEILLLDEPLASLDLRNQIGMAALVADLARQQGLTVLLIAHDVNPLLNLIDRVLYVAHGQTAIGKPGEMITSETLTRLYGAEVEVLRDRHGHLYVVGLEDEIAHPHGAAP